MNATTLKRAAIIALACLALSGCLPLTPAMKARMTPEQITQYEASREIFLKGGGIQGLMMGAGS